MSFLKEAYYMTCGILMTAFHFQGSQLLMNITFCLWLPVFAWDFAQWLTPYQDVKKR